MQPCKLATLAMLAMLRLSCRLSALALGWKTCKSGTGAMIDVYGGASLKRDTVIAAVDDAFRSQNSFQRNVPHFLGITVPPVCEKSFPAVIIKNCIPAMKIASD